MGYIKIGYRLTQAGLEALTVEELEEAIQQADDVYERGQEPLNDLMDALAECNQFGGISARKEVVDAKDHASSDAV